MKNNIKILFHIFLILTFLAGIYVCLTNGILNVNKEGVENNDSKPDCPDLLIKRGNALLLYNSNAPEIDGVNPLPFNSLDEYINYLEIQRRKGINCPVLFLQQENDVQGNDVYRMRPSPFYIEGGLPPLPLETHDNSIVQNIIDSSRDNPPYNANNYAVFDAHGQDVGRYTNIDQLHNSTMNTQTAPSENPMDSNWGGILLTKNAVDSGKYANNEVTRVIYPKVIPVV